MIAFIFSTPSDLATTYTLLQSLSIRLSPRKNKQSDYVDKQEHFPIWHQQITYILLLAIIFKYK